MTNMNITSITIDSSAYPEFIDNHSCAIIHTSNNTPLSVEQVLILDHVAMLLNILKSKSSRGLDPQDNNGMVTVDDRDIVARIDGLLKCYGKYETVTH